MHTFCSKAKDEKTNLHYDKKLSINSNKIINEGINDNDNKNENKNINGNESYYNSEYLGLNKMENNKTKCTTSTFLVFNSPKSLIISCVLLKYENNHFLNCIKKNYLDGGAICVKKAFISCFSSLKMNNEIDNIMGIQSEEHNSYLTSNFHINSQLAKEKIRLAANNVKDFFLGIHHKKENINENENENGNENKMLGTDDNDSDNENENDNLIRNIDVNDKPDLRHDKYLKRFYDYGNKQNSVFSSQKWKLDRNARLFWISEKAFEGNHLLYKEGSLFATALNRNNKLNRNIYECNNCTIIENYNNYNNANDNSNDNKVNEKTKNDINKNNINRRIMIQNGKYVNENIFENINRNSSSRKRAALTAAAKQFDAMPESEKDMIEKKLLEISVSDPDERTFSKEKEHSLNILIVGSVSSGVDLLLKTLSQHPNIITAHTNYNTPIYKYFNYKNNITNIDYNQIEKTNYYHNKKNEKKFFNSKFKIQTEYKKFKSCNKKITLFEKSNLYKIQFLESSKFNNWNCFPFIEQNENLITIDKIDFPLSEENILEMKRMVSNESLLIIY